MAALGTIYFYACAALALAGALATVISKNPIRGAMGLLLLILSVAGLFLALHAQFLAAIQLIVYAGAIVVLFLFVIMLLGPSASTPNDRRGITARVIGGAVFALTGLGALALLVKAAMAAHRPLPMPTPDAGFGGIDAFGSVLFSDALVPFELSSALLMVAVVGAIAVAKGRQGVPSLSRSEQAIADMPAPPPLEPQRESSGVFSHEIDNARSLVSQPSLERAGDVDAHETDGAKEHAT
jgi:NADH-quinone oxidoreductase subunit J